MTYQAAMLGDPPPIFFANEYFGTSRAGVVFTRTQTSTAWTAANRALLFPFYLNAPYVAQRFFWLNGTTVGTDSFEAGIYDDSLDVIVQSARTLSASASVPQFATCSVGCKPITSGTDSTDGTSFTTASVTLKARPGYMYLLAFSNSKASAAQAASTVATTGGALSFTSRNSQTYGASTEGRVSVWTAVPTSDVTDTIKIDFGGGNTQTGCAWSLVCFTNVDTATNHGIVQTAVGSGNSTTPLATLSAFGSANNATFGSHGTLSGAATQGTNFIEIHDLGYSTPTNRVYTEFYAGNDTTVDATITSGQWGSVAAEVKSLGTSWTLGPGAYWLALWCSGTTATVQQTNNASTLGAMGAYIQSSIADGLPITLTPASNGQLNAAAVCGITNRSSP